MIVLKNVTKYYGTTRALDNISLELENKQKVVLFGRSGSGKTTMLRIIAGLEVPSEGEVYFDDVLASTPEYSLEPYKRNIGFVFQQNSLWNHMTVGENIAFGLYRLSKEERFKRVGDLLHKIELTAHKDKYPDELSGGEARRVEIARAVASLPRHLFFDEPLINLDLELKQKLLQLIDEVQQQAEGVVLYVTHDMEEAHSISQDILTLENGKIV